MKDTTHPSRDLEAWLEVATHGLCGEARERIRHEVTDHYDSAHEEAVASGASAPAAEHSALSGLGDPTEAGRAFRRTNLTRFQAALVRDHRGRPSRRILMLHATVIAAGIGVVAVFPDSPTERTIGLASLALMTGALAVLHVLAPWWARSGRAKTAVMAGAVAQWLFYAGTCVGLPFSTGGGTGPYAAAFYGACLVTLLALYLPLIRKVKHSDLHPISSG